MLHHECQWVTYDYSSFLLLGADQTAKIRRNTSLNGGPVHSFHLDELWWCPQAQQYLAKCILLLFFATNTTVIFILSSPQAIINNQLSCGGI
jgi:hypothetical protein